MPTATPPTPPDAPPKPPRVPNLNRLVLLQFYRKHNPGKEGRVDLILEKFAGKEDKLWASLQGKYGEDPRELYAAALRPTASSTAAAPATPAATPPPKRRGILHALGLARRSDLEEERKVANANRGRAAGIEKLRTMEKKEMASLVVSLQNMLTEQVHATHRTVTELRERATAAEAAASQHEEGAAEAHVAAQELHHALKVDVAQTHEELLLSRATSEDHVQRLALASAALESARGAASGQESLLRGRIQALEERVAASADDTATLHEAMSASDLRVAASGDELRAAQHRADELALSLSDQTDALSTEEAAYAKQATHAKRLELKVEAVVHAAGEGQKALHAAQARAKALAAEVEEEKRSRARVESLGEASAAELASECEEARKESARQAQSLRELRASIASSEDGAATVQTQMQDKVDSLLTELHDARVERAVQERMLEARVETLSSEAAKSQLQIAAEQEAGAELAIALEIDTVQRFEAEIGRMQIHSSEEIAMLANAAVKMEGELNARVQDAEERADRLATFHTSEAHAVLLLRSQVDALNQTVEGTRFEQDALQQLLGVACDRAESEAENAGRADKRCATLDKELGTTRARLASLQSDSARVQSRIETAERRESEALGMMAKAQERESELVNSRDKAKSETKAAQAKNRRARARHGEELEQVRARANSTVRMLEERAMRAAMSQPAVGAGDGGGGGGGGGAALGGATPSAESRSTRRSEVDFDALSDEALLDLMVDSEEEEEEEAVAEVGPAVATKRDAASHRADAGGEGEASARRVGGQGAAASQPQHRGAAGTDETPAAGTDAEAAAGASFVGDAGDAKSFALGVDGDSSDDGDDADDEFPLFIPGAHAGNTDELEGEVRIQAVVRMRPMMPHEIAQAESYRTSSDIALRSQHNTVVRIDGSRSEPGAAAVVCTDPTAYLMLGNAGCSADGRLKDAVQRQVFETKFEYDAAVSSRATQAQTFECLMGVCPVTRCVQKGHNVTILAYGQTGSGKTWSMLGSDRDPTLEGIVPRTLRSLLNIVSSDREDSIEVGFFEIYNEQVRDLLAGDDAFGSVASGKPIRVRQGKRGEVFIEGLKRRQIYPSAGGGGVEEAVASITHLINAGLAARATSKTGMNAVSSRSHAIFDVKCRVGGRTAKVRLCDLAGSERFSAVADGDKALKSESAAINSSLTTLGDCLAALVKRSSEPGKGKTFVPYRNSMLTWILKDSLGGNSRTVMLGAVAPCAFSWAESVSSLRFIAKAKLIVNRVRADDGLDDMDEVCVVIIFSFDCMTEYSTILINNSGES